jgi:tryptophan aminotransferase
MQREDESLVQVSIYALIMLWYLLLHIHDTVRGIAHLEATPGLISLRAGRPNASTFPFTSLSFTARSPSDPSNEVHFDLSKADLAQGLQYGETAGLAELRDWFTGLQEISHGRKRGEGWRVSVGSGSQDLIYKVWSVK